MSEIKKVRKLVIPAAGWGTRFLPFTKAVHKELLPILNKPVIQYLVEEAKDSGIEEIILVLAERKRNIANYFNPNHELQAFLTEKNKDEMLKEIKKTNNTIKITIAIQEEQLGLGHAIFCAKPYVKNEPFAIILGDDLVEGKVPAIKQLINYYNEVQSSVFGVQKVEKHNLHKYGIVKPQQANSHESGFRITDAIEKPTPEEAPSDYAILGRYVLTPNIFQVIENTEADKNGEINLIENMVDLTILEPVYAYEFEGTRYDMGSIEGFVKATIDFSLKNDEIKEKIKKYIQEKEL